MITSHTDEDSNSSILNEGRFRDPVTLHQYLSCIPYGDEEESCLEAVTTELVLQIPWTSQLRLCSRLPRLQKQLLPHIWNKVQYLQDGDIIDNDSWMSDSLILCWKMNRYHIQNDLTPLPRLLRIIMERIDSILGLEEPLREDGSHILSAIGKSPIIALKKYQDHKRDHQPSIHSHIHPEFLMWMAEQTCDGKLQESLLILCNYIGRDGSNLSHVNEMFDTLPLELMTHHLSEFEVNKNHEVTQIGFALLIAFLKRRGVNIKTDPLPPDLILGNNNCLPAIIQGYLYQGIPNVNNLVLYLWTEQYSELLSQFSHWLPLEPILPLVRRALQTRIDWEVSIDMFFCLSWGTQHLYDVFTPVLGDDLPNNPIEMKEAFRRSLHSPDDVQNPSKLGDTASLEGVQRTWGLNVASKQIYDTSRSRILMNSTDDDQDDEDTDYSFDETDDRVLLL
jgi:hypothetical protein